MDVVVVVVHQSVIQPCFPQWVPGGVWLQASLEDCRQAERCGLKDSQRTCGSVLLLSEHGSR